MRPGRELNIRIAREVFGHRVWKFKGELTENPASGNRPLRNYSNDIQWAFEVASKMKVTLIPVIDGNWFAFVGGINHPGWESPQAVFQFLEAGNFNESGAAVDKNPALAICIAAIKAVEKQAVKNNPNGPAIVAEPVEENTDQLH
jgi:hypothetical protein